MSQTKSVRVFAGELWQATMIKNLLDENEIPAFLENELMGTIAPWRVSAGGMAPVVVIVEDVNEERALKLIEEFNQADWETEDSTEED